MPQNTMCEKENDLKLQLPFGPPPVCPDALKQLEQYLLDIEQLPTYNYEKSHKFWSREPQLSTLLNFSPSLFATTLKPERDPKTGELLRFKEVFVTDFADVDEFNDKSCSNPANNEISIDFENLMSTPPGMKCGYDFNVVDTQQFPVLPAKKNVINLTNILQVEDSLGLTIQEKKKDVKKEEIKETKPKPVAKVVNIDTEEQEEVIPVESSIPVLKISETPSLKVLEKADWAEELAVKPVLDFKERVPKMAYKWDFELDPFQQLAIVKLEEDGNVFVAAHTSAGKTVVAEYAIALSLQRCTRAIYTSPIKALSNQKYRDFRSNFEITKKMGEVGLITGDIQVNPKAPCLIMTTEILRSMLYNKSEVVQDLEFVIFDEVHYINDPDRGHVWEEVMMLLQSHVKIVMLSATVPNAIEFANWVGQIKKKKVYLICTQNRPVPLHFYLYTGTHDGNTDNMFLVRKAEGLWDHKEYHKAEMSRLCLEKPTGGRGGRGGRGGGKGRGGTSNDGGINTQAQERKLWISFVNYLKKKDKLPVVTFVLSRGRCDYTAHMLVDCINLVSHTESASITNFFKKSIIHLKAEDQGLPQVSNMGKLLSKGIGIHHSGILPILKEIVEMLFQQGQVKLLLATETFAMGVNMPTKTVVFESIRKYDGNDWRNLLPAEFIQMAGRAGRRGIDKTGTVAIMCKNRVPPERDLRNMMFNKPSKLESQFKMTYATILKNLLRTNEATNPVERMMSSSFKEFSEQSKHGVYLEKLNKVKWAYESLMEEKSQENSGKHRGYESLEDFYEDALDFISLRKEVQEFQLGEMKIAKDLVPGRVIVVAVGPFSNRLGLILSTDRNKKMFQVLILVNQNDGHYDPKCDHKSEKCICHDEIYFRMRDIVRGSERFVPDTTNYMVIKIEPQNIMEITTMTDNMKLNYDAVLNDWRYRQCNKNHTPNDETFHALRGLLEKSSYFAVNHIVNIYKKLEPPSLTYKTSYDKLQSLRCKLRVYSFRSIPNCDNLFTLVYKYKKLEGLRESYNKKISEFSMSEDFKSKLEILKELKYVDSSNSVELKGRGAIRMTTNEIMVTELIFRNTLSDFEPAEIAALLSCLVFQAKTNVKIEEVLTPRLLNGRDLIKEIHEELQKIENKHMNNMTGESAYEFVDLNFGLVQVVYEWACDKVFSEIMKLTDVQEGIIVRCIQQLNEVLRCVKEVAQKVGDCTLESKMDKASNAIKRDIVFAASLYLQ